MGALFGKHKKNRSRITEQDKAVLQLKQQRDKLKQYYTKISLNLERERELAKKLIQENKKDKAKLLLRKKKYEEQILQRTDQQLENLEKMVHDIEFAVVEIEVINGLKAGNEALKKIHAVISVEDVERLMDETHEAVEKQREIDEVLSGALSNEDEEDVLDELNAIIQENAQTATNDELPNEVELPDVPTEDIGQKEARVKAKKQMAATS